VGELNCLLEGWETALDSTAKTPPSADDVEWVVNDLAELGVRIGGRCFFLYKGESLVYATEKHDDGTPMHVRRVGNREFGECCHPPNIDEDVSSDTTGWYDAGTDWEPL
jgi:hypothetical protein